jgi:hypothetical protein
MKLILCDQGSEPWHMARCGAITASCFKLTRASERLKSGPNKGDYNEKAKNYAFRLAVERISGVPLDEGFETWQMKRGHELEPAARQEHETQAGLIVVPAGFVATDDGWFGASADGLIDEDGGSEYKCLVSPEGLRDVLLNDDISEFADQIQGCLWITGRKWWHFGLYCPALQAIGKQFYWREVRRDDDYIGALEKDLIEFNRLVMKYRYQLERVQASAEPMKIAA